MQSMFLKIADISKYNLKSHFEMSRFITHSDKAIVAFHATDSSTGSVVSAIQQMHKCNVFMHFF